MNKDDAVFFAGQMEDFLDIPSMFCEKIEKMLNEGKAMEVCEYIVRRRMELLKNPHKTCCGENTENDDFL